MTQFSINLSLASQTERLNSLCNGLVHLSVPGRPHTLVLGVTAWIVLGWCPFGQVPSIIAISTGARREYGLLMTHVLNCKGTTDPQIPCPHPHLSSACVVAGSISLVVVSKSNWPVVAARWGFGFQLVRAFV